MSSRLRQWINFAGDSWTSRCTWNAAAAAEELAGHGHENSAASSAEAAVRHAGYVRIHRRTTTGRRANQS